MFWNPTPTERIELSLSGSAERSDFAETDFGLTQQLWNIGGEAGPFLADSNVDGSGTVTPSTDIFLHDVMGDYQARVVRVVLQVRF